MLYLVLFILNFITQFVPKETLELTYSIILLFVGFKGKKINKIFVIIYMLTIAHCSEVMYQIVYSLFTHTDYSYLCKYQYNKYIMHINVFYFVLGIVYYYFHFNVFMIKSF